MPSQSIMLASVPEVLDGGLATVLSPERVARWLADRGAFGPRIYVTRDQGRITAAALTTARPSTSAIKIADLWGEGPAQQAVLDAVFADARARELTALKWEYPSDETEPLLAARNGFSRLRPPIPSGSSTEGTSGLVTWLRPIPHGEPRYYGQTTLFTCGAVAALIADDARGGPGFTGTDATTDRDIEFAFWRRASNYPACEPVGLAVALREHTSAPTIDIALDADGPVLVEDYSGFERDFRAELQEESRRKAADLGIPITSERVSINEIGRRVADGELALLLIDETLMHGEQGPHWILAHAFSDGVFLVEDPWADAARGETWVDAHLMPIGEDDLDRMIAWGPDAYRGVIFVGR